MINKSIRELDRERTALQNSEKKLITDIKKAAKDGQMVRALPHFARIPSSRLTGPRCSDSAENRQNHGKGPGADEAVRH